MTALITPLNYFSDFKTKLRIIIIGSLFYSIGMLSFTIFLGICAFLIETYKIDVFHEGRMSLDEIVWKFSLIWIVGSFYILVTFTWITLKFDPVFEDEDFSFLKKGILRINPIAVYVYWPIWFFVQIYIRAFVKKDLLKIIGQFIKELFTDP